MLANPGFHASKNMTIPENIKLIRIPAYTPELNPCWKSLAMDEKVAMKFFEDVEAPQTKVAQMIHDLNPKLMKSIIGYELYPLNIKITHRKFNT